MQKFFNVTAATEFSIFSQINASAVSLNGSIPAVRVTWNTTAPPNCVASVRVNFRTSSMGPVVAHYTSTKTSRTAVIQTGLRCGANYYVTVIITGKPRDRVSARLQITISQVRVLAGGKKLCEWDLNSDVMVALPLHRCTCPSWSERRTHCRQHKYQSVLGVAKPGTTCVCSRS